MSKFNDKVLEIFGDTLRSLGPDARHSIVAIELALADALRKASSKATKYSTTGKLDKK